MDFVITVLLAGLSGWLVNFLFKNSDLAPIVYFFIGLLGGTLVSFIFQSFKIPFLSGHLGTFCFSLIGSILIYSLLEIRSRFKSTAK